MTNMNTLNNSNVTSLAVHRKPTRLENSEHFNIGADTQITDDDSAFVAQVRQAHREKIEAQYIEVHGAAEMPAEFGLLADIAPDFAVVEKGTMLAGEPCDLAIVGEVALLATFPALCDAMNAIYPDQNSHSS